MKNTYLILNMIIVLFLIGCDKNPIQPINNNYTPTISHDSILYNINSGNYYKYDNSYERGVVGTVKLVNNSIVVDSTTSVDSVFMYADFNVEIQYNHCQQQLLSDLANNNNLSISQVDTPTHVIFNSSRCFVAYGLPSTHLNIFHYYIQDPIITVKFEGTDGRMVGLEPCNIRIAGQSKSKISTSYTSIFNWSDIISDDLGLYMGNADFVLGAINVKRGAWFEGRRWSRNF